MEKKYLFAAIFITALLFAAYVRYQYIFAESIWVDESVYMWQGYKILHEPSLLFTKDYYGNTPFPLLVIAFFNIFTADRFVAGRLAAYAFSLFGIILAYFLGKELKDELTGLVAMVLLTFNPLHWFLSSRTLMDLPEATMVSLSVYLLLRFEKQRTMQNLVFLLLAVGVTALTKIPGLLIVPGILLYYALKALSSPARAFEILKQKQIRVGTGIVGVLSLLLLAAKASFIMGLVKTLEPRFIFFQQFPFMFSITILFLLAGAALLTPYYRNWNAVALFCVFASFVAAFSLLPAEPDPRHIVPVIPLGIVLASFALFEIGEFAKLVFHVPHSEWGFFALGLLLAYPLYAQGTALNTEKSYAFTGYNEAGQWIAHNLPAGALIYASSQGPMRLFSGLGYANENGPMRQIQTFGDGAIPDFSKAALPIYIHIDVWESGPAWSYPLNEQKVQSLQAQGFSIEKVVIRKFPTDKGLQDFPAHVILVKKETS